MQAILLAGGLGTRLRSVVSDRPKPMALVEGRPFMEYVVHELSRRGITDIIFAVGYKGSMVEDYFGDGSRFAAPDGAPLRIRYAYEKELLGTAGAIRNAGRLVTEDCFFVLNADTFYQLDYGRLARLQERLGLDMALVLRGVPDVSRYGQAVLGPAPGTALQHADPADGQPAGGFAEGAPAVTEGFLTGFNEKAAGVQPGTINGGVYLMARELLADIPEGKVSLENEMIPRWLKEGRRLGGFVNDGYFIDIGIPEAYFRFQEDVRNGAVVW